MSRIQNIIEYPEEGFAILRDTQGSFLAFRDTDRFEPLEETGPVYWPKSWRMEREMPAKVDS